MRALAIAVIFLAQRSFCGVIEKSPLIVGGIPADVRDFPHQLALIDMIRGGKNEIFHQHFVTNQTKFDFQSCRLVTCAVLQTFTDIGLCRQLIAWILELIRSLSICMVVQQAESLMVICSSSNVTFCIRVMTEDLLIWISQ